MRISVQRLVLQLQQQSYGFNKDYPGSMSAQALCLNLQMERINVQVIKLNEEALQAIRSLREVKNQSAWLLLPSWGWAHCALEA